MDIDSMQREYLPAERQDMILSLLTRQSSATVTELAELLRTTEITVRRDLTVLAKAGLLKRVRGGAMSVASSAEAANAARAIDASPAATGIADSSAFGGTPYFPIRANVELSDTQPAIGVMLPEPSFFWPQVIDHMREIAAMRGMRVITRESSYEPNIDETTLLDDLVSNPTVCAIVAAPQSTSLVEGGTWEWIMRATVPVVTIERPQPLLADHTIDSVRTNHHYGVRKAAAHFLGRGHTRIGAAFTDTPTSHQILEGWNLVLKGTDRIECPFTFTGIQPYSSTGVEDVVKKIIATKVTAMLIHSDYLAIAVAQSLERHGKRVPEDVSIISIDGFATPSSRPLTVLRSPARDLAANVVDTVVNRIQYPETATKQIFVDPILVDRGSVRPLAERAAA